MKMEEIEKALSRGYFGEYHLEICHLLSRIRTLEEGIKETQQLISHSPNANVVAGLSISIINNLQKLLEEN